MNKIVSLFTMMLLTAFSATALEFTMSGEIRTGFYTDRISDQSGKRSESSIHNNAGGSRTWLNLNLEAENFGMRTRYSQGEWGPRAKLNTDFIYAYSMLMENQLKVSAGMLGESPWGADGPDLWRHVDNQIGIRFEWMPNFIPGLNVGFVLNRYNAIHRNPRRTETWYDILMDSVLGIAYDHDFFAFRFSWRLDSLRDQDFIGDEGHEFVYHAEERILDSFLPGLQISANGYYRGLNSAILEREFFDNYFYVRYKRDVFSVYLNSRLFTDIRSDNSKLLIKPGFYYGLFDGFLDIGFAAGIEKGFKEAAAYLNSFYNFWFVEPNVRMNITDNSYINVVYNYTKTYVCRAGNTSDVNWLNIRVGFAF